MSTQIMTDVFTIGQQVDYDRPAVTSSLSAVDWHAIQVAAKDAKAVRGELTPGVYPVSLTVHIEGTLKVGTDTEAVRKKSPDMSDVLAFVLGHFSQDMQRSIMEQAELACDEQGKISGIDEPAKFAASELMAKLTRTEKIKRNGAVSGQFLVHRS